MNSNELSTSPIQNTKDFFVKFTSPDTGRVYEGQFTTKKLSIKGMMAVQVKKIQLNGGYYFDEDKPGVGIDEQTDWTNYMIAHLEQSLIRKPTWWNLDELDDIDLVIHVFKEVASFESSAKSPLRGAAISVSGSQTNSGGTNTQSGAAGHITPMGRGEVSTSLDP